MGKCRRDRLLPTLNISHLQKCILSPPGSGVPRAALGEHCQGKGTVNHPEPGRGLGGRQLCGGTQKKEHRGSRNTECLGGICPGPFSSSLAGTGDAQAQERHQKRQKRPCLLEETHQGPAGFI